MSIFHILGSFFALYYFFHMECLSIWNSHEIDFFICDMSYNNTLISYLLFSLIVCFFIFYSIIVSGSLGKLHTFTVFFVQCFCSCATFHTHTLIELFTYIFPFLLAFDVSFFVLCIVWGSPILLIYLQMHTILIIEVYYCFRYFTWILLLLIISLFMLFPYAYILYFSILTISFLILWGSFFINCVVCVYYVLIVFMCSLFLNSFFYCFYLGCLVFIFFSLLWFICIFLYFYLLFMYSYCLWYFLFESSYYLKMFLGYSILSVLFFFLLVGFICLYFVFLLLLFLCFFFFFYFFFSGFWIFFLYFFFYFVMTWVLLGVF